MKSVREAKVRGKRVLVRADLDVPIRVTSGESRIEARRFPNPSGWRKETRRVFPRRGVSDDFRIRACLSTLEYLVKEGAKVIISGHLNRPGGKVVEELRLDPVAEVLSEHLEAVHKADEIIGPVIESVIGDMEEGDILLLENLRFHPGEEENDSQFAKELAGLADLFVNEAFAVCHRSHASVVGVTKYLPSYVGLRLEEEIEKLIEVRENPQRPLIFIIGGAKAETKAPLVRKISEYADQVLLGGTLMFERFLEGLPNVVFPTDAIDLYDIGPKTVEIFKEILSEAKTVVWNGPLGKFEEPRFSRGTRIVADYLTRISADVVVGGGDTLAALKELSLREKIGFVSVGGGAMLAYLAGEKLPGIEALHSSNSVVIQ